MSPMEPASESHGAAGQGISSWDWVGPGLVAPERFLIERYLCRGGKTLEAGTRRGHILRVLSELAFTDVVGFDNVPELLEEIRSRDWAQRFDLSAQDAWHLSYADGEFKQIIYFGILSLTNETGRREAVAEAYRVLRRGGTALFSFFCSEVGLQSVWFRAMIANLACVRTPSRHREPLERTALTDGSNGAGPEHVHWFATEEAANLLAAGGFAIVGMGTRRQIQDGKMCRSVEELTRLPRHGLLYVVCRK